MTPTNPFRYGSLALDEAFADREAELAELNADILNGQDVVIFAPRRFGKSSLVWRSSQQLVLQDVLVGHVNLMTAPTKEKLAEKLARTIHDEIASPLFRARERLRIFEGLRITPVVTVDPNTGALGFTFQAGRSPEDVDATLERLLELPAQLAAERDRRVAVVFDEFQEVVEIDPNLPKLMRSVFQEQPEVAHVYLGSKRHMMERIFNDENEPFWRSAKRIELSTIPPPLFRDFVLERFAGSGKPIDPGLADGVLEITQGHPYATQELCYFLWEAIGSSSPTEEHLTEALTRVLHSEHAHFSLIWDRASKAQRLLLQGLAAESGRPLAGEYRRRHRLPGPSTVQRALEALVRDELVRREPNGEYRIAEPFLAEWLRRDEP
jgi:hypothetical protein